MAPLVPEPVQLLANGPERGLAVFDADGVLWHGDISEDFALWMIGEGHFDGRLWPVYERCNSDDPASGCTQILSFYTGTQALDLATHVELFWQKGPPRRWLTRVRATLRWARANGFEIYIVSATPAPVLRPLKRHIEVDHVLGLDLELDENDRYTGRTAGISTIGVGKAERIRAQTRHPIRLAVGDSTLDVPMLTLSSGVAWAINPDSKLREIAEERGWLVTREPEE